MSLVRPGELRLAPEGQGPTAGIGPRCRPDRALEAAWRKQLRRWNVECPDDASAYGRVWRVVLADQGRRTETLILPSGTAIRVFEDGLAGAHRRHGDHKVEGPHYVLTFDDAWALWRDIHCSVMPVPSETTRLNLRQYARQAQAV